ncbi:MAG: rod shape-determining protein MreC [Bacillota bacterium]
MIRLKKYRTPFVYLIIVVLLLVSIRLTGFERPTLSQGEAFIRNLLAPLQSGVMVIGQKANNFLSQIANYAEISDENERLAEEVARLTAENNLLTEYKQENARLRKLLGLQDLIGTQFSLTAARVTARDLENLHQTLIINKGSEDGIRKDMPVINEQGLIGRIINVTDRTSEVLLILDREGAVGAMVQQTRVPGVVEGLGPGSDQLQMIHINVDAPIGVNQVIITSGYGGIFPKGLRIGYVKEIIPEANGLMKRAVIQPFVDFDRLEEILVVTGVVDS